VLDALQNLHHPSRTTQSQKYLQRTLELLQEVQVTGDIFFPARWLTESFQNHNSAGAVAVVDDFLAVNPTYNRQLRMKVLQAADKPMRAQRILAAAP
jgi:aminopeptidase N